MNERKRFTSIPGIILAALALIAPAAEAALTLSLDKTALPTTYSAAGQMISYSYVVTNTGDEPSIDGGSCDQTR